MDVVKIREVKALKNHLLSIEFSDGKAKIIDIGPLIKEDHLTVELKDFDFFKKVRIYECGRGVFWPNEFDLCPDFLYQCEETNLPTLA